MPRCLNRKVSFTEAGPRRGYRRGDLRRNSRQAVEPALALARQTVSGASAELHSTTRETETCALMLSSERMAPLFGIESPPVASLAAAHRNPPRGTSPTSKPTRTQSTTHAVICETCRRRGFRLPTYALYRPHSVAEQFARRSSRGTGCRRRATTSREVPRRYQRQSGLGEVRVARQEVLRRGVGRLVKLPTRPPPEIMILRPILRVGFRTLRGRPAAAGFDAHISPAAPPPMIPRPPFLSRHPLHSRQSRAYAACNDPQGSDCPPRAAAIARSALACQRFLEAHWNRGGNPRRRGAAAHGLHDSEPGWDTYVERPATPSNAQMAINTPPSPPRARRNPLLGGTRARVPSQRCSLRSLVTRVLRPEQVHLRLWHGIQVLLRRDSRRRTVTVHRSRVGRVRAGGIFMQR